MPGPVVLCDANVFYSILLTDLILSLAEAGLFRPRWTNEIHEEWIRNVLKNQPERTREELERRRSFMDQAIEHDLIKGYEQRIANLNLPDPDDRHVLAAALEAGAEIVLTYNLRDFPAKTLAAYGVSPMHPDEFLCRQMAAAPKLVLAVIEQMRVKRTRPGLEQEQLLSKLARLDIPQFVRSLREAGYGSQDGK